MFKSTVRGMLAHKLRLALTTASIALGVAFLAGTLILTDTMKLAFEQLFGKVSAGTDAVVRQEAAFDQGGGVGLSRGPIDASVLEQVRTVDGVRAAEGSISGYALLTDTEGKAVTTAGGAPTMGYNLPDDGQLRGETKILSGHAPRGRHEVAIDASSAEDHDIPLGSTIKVLFRGPTEEFTVVGTVGFGDSKDLGGTTGAYFDTSTAAAVLGQPATYDSIGVSAEDGVSDAALAKRLDAVVPDGTEAVTGAAVAQESSDAVNEDLTFVTILFGVFAGIALFVGSFIIWNTFTMIVSQRSREIALLRAVGATRRQVMRNLVTEAFLLGAFASAVGLALGVAVAKGLTFLMDAVGFSLPSTATQIEPRTIVVSLVVGTLVTVVASVIPARRATKVLPVEALREATPGSRPPSRTRAVLGTLMGGAGLAGVFTGLYSGGGGRMVMLGILGVVLGVMTLAPLAARPLAAAIGGTAATPWPPGRPRPAERHAQPAPHRVDRGRPDDRADPGGQHGRLRVVAEGVLLRHPRRLDERGPLPDHRQRTGRGLQPRGQQGGSRGARV